MKAEGEPRHLRVWRHIRTLEAMRTQGSFNRNPHRIRGLAIHAQNHFDFPTPA